MRVSPIRRDTRYMTRTVSRPYIRLNDEHTVAKQGEMTLYQRSRSSSKAKLRMAAQPQTTTWLNAVRQTPVPNGRQWRIRYLPSHLVHPFALSCLHPHPRCIRRIYTDHLTELCAGPSAQKCASCWSSTLRPYSHGMNSLTRTFSFAHCGMANSPHDSRLQRC